MALESRIFEWDEEKAQINKKKPDALNDEGRGLIRGMIGSLRLTHGKNGRSMGYGSVAGNRAAAMKG